LASSIRRASRDTAQYLVGVTRGDLGVIGVQSGRYIRYTPVSTVLVDTYPKSLALLVLAVGLGGLIGVPLGLAAATHSGSRTSSAILTISVLGMSVPSFLLAALVQLIEVVWHRRTQLRLIPVGGFGWDLHLVIPVLVLSARPIAQTVRVAYLSFSDVLVQPHLLTARAKGLLPRVVRNRHVWRNAAVPVMSSLGLSLRHALSSLPVVEYFVGWPGMGRRLLDVVRAGQAEGVVGLALAFGLTIMLVNSALDALYRRLDPRIGGQAS